MSRASVLVVAFALVVTACGAPTGDPGRATTASVSVPVSTSAALVKVPDVSGMNHQDAQNTMQKAGLYNLREVDGTGRHRALLVDRNWVQTAQDPAPGTEVPPDAVITLTAVKYTER
jgi:beta-lactam-binding protein with PASTA domain